MIVKVLLLTYTVATNLCGVALSQQILGSEESLQTFELCINLGSSRDEETISL